MHVTVSVASVNSDKSGVTSKKVGFFDKVLSFPIDLSRQMELKCDKFQITHQTLLTFELNLNLNKIEYKRNLK